MRQCVRKVGGQLEKTLKRLVARGGQFAGVPKLCRVTGT